MKTTILRIISALLVLSVLWAIVPSVRADDDYVTEVNQYVNQIYQDQQNLNDYLQSIQDGIDQVVQQRDEILNSIGNGQADAAVAVPQPEAPLASPVPAPPANFHPQPVPQDPVAFKRMVLQNQAKVQQAILQGQQQMMQRIQELAQQRQQLIASRRH
jgi:cell division septum initiation protein DivIVA